MLPQSATGLALFFYIFSDELGFMIFVCVLDITKGLHICERGQSGALRQVFEPDDGYIWFPCLARSLLQ